MLDREYSIIIDKVEINKCWRDITIIDNTKKKELFESYQQSPAILESVFRELYRVQSNYIEGKRNISFEELIEKAIERGRNKGMKTIRDRVSLIAVVDPIMGLGNEIDQYESEENDKFIKRMTENQIIVVGVTTYFSDWFRSLDINPYQIRVYSPSKDMHNLDGEAIVFRNAKNILNRRDGEKSKEIYILGGTKTFKKLFPRVTDLHLTYVEKIMPSVTQYFSILNMGVLNTLSVDPLKDDKYPEGLSRVHLRFAKNKIPEWKNTNDQLQGKPSTLKRKVR